MLAVMDCIAAAWCAAAGNVERSAELVARAAKLIAECDAEPGIDTVVRWFL